MVKKEERIVEEITECPECGSTVFETDDVRAETVCGECGLVQDIAPIDHGPDWRAYNIEELRKKARTGAPMDIMYHDKGLSTTIGWKNKDSYGKSIPPRNRPQLYRIRKWQKRTRISDATGRNLFIALSELDKRASQMKLPRTVKEAAAFIYRKAVKEKLIRGRRIEEVVTAALYAACRQLGFSRTLDEMVAVSGFERKKIGTIYRVLSNRLGLRIRPPSPKEYVRRFCDELRLSNDVINKAIEIVEEAVKKDLVMGKSPAGTTAAAIYISSVLCGEKRTQRKVADVAGVTEVTIRTRYKEIVEKLEITDFFDKYF